eukprot:5772835-Alexandrium_andersonii.AAC.1
MVAMPRHLFALAVACVGSPCSPHNRPFAGAIASAAQQRVVHMPASVTSTPPPLPQAMLDEQLEQRRQRFSDCLDIGRRLRVLQAKGKQPPKSVSV